MSPQDRGSLTRRCPGCAGPITFTADDSGGVTVDFHCSNRYCQWGKHEMPTTYEPGDAVLILATVVGMTKGGGVRVAIVGPKHVDKFVSAHPMYVQRESAK